MSTCGYKADRLWGGVMSGAKVRGTINFMCRFYLDFDDLTRMIPELLDDRVITHL
jgi:hypothetical protein